MRQSWAPTWAGRPARFELLADAQLPALGRLVDLRTYLPTYENDVWSDFRQLCITLAASVMYLETIPRRNEM